MANTYIKAGQFSGVIGNGTNGYFLMSSGNGNMTWAQASTGPSVTSVTYPGDDTAADPAGGQTVVLTGTGFATSGMVVSIGGTTAPSVAHDSNTQLTITTPVKAAGDYDVVVTNTVTGASGTFVNGISYNGVPTWTTAAGSLGTFESETTISTITLQATEPDGGTITFNITNGALPTGLSLTGANIDGTTTAESSTTLYSFTIEAIDDENQATPRNFSITVNSAEIVSSENFTINTYTGNGSTQAIEGKIGTAASFNGSNSYIATTGNISGGQDFSISLWCYLNTSTAQEALFTMGSATNNGLFIYRSGQQMALDSFGATRYNNNTFFTENTWQHLVITYSSGTNNIYLDGSFVDTFSYTWNINAAATTYIGAQIAAFSRYLNGKLDQVRIFNTALDQAKVTQLAAENNASSTKSTTDIFDDGSGVALYEFEKGAIDTGGTNGYIGSAGVFNGAGGNGISTNLITSNTQDLTWSVWVKGLTHNQSASANSIFTLYKDNYAWLNFNSNGTITGRHRSSANVDVDVVSGVINSTVWTHVVFVSSLSGGNKIYINGSLIDSNTTSITSRRNDINAGTGLYIGNNPADLSGPYALKGQIDQIRIFNKALSSSEVTTLYGETSASATKSTADIFDDGSGVALYELEGNANDTGRGTIDSGQSAVFNGSSSHIDFPSPIPYTNTDMTFSCSINLASAFSSGYQTIVGAGNKSVGEGIIRLLIRYDSANSYKIEPVRAYSGNSYYTDSSNYPAQTINAGSWYNVTYSYSSSGNTAKIYLNGSLVSTTNLTTTSTDTVNSGVLALGQYRDSTGFFNGKIDQVRIFNTALDPSDVVNLVSETNVPTANLVAHYKLDGNALDETTNYNGTANSVTYSDPAEFPAYNGTATNVSYAYDGTPTNVSFLGTSFTPDFVWIKSRSSASWSHFLQDSVRGVANFLISNSTGAEATTLPNIVGSFDANGFTVLGNGNSNNLNDTYVAWCWKAGSAAVSNTNGTITSTVSANPDAGFSIVSFNGSTGSWTAGHGLNDVPKMVIYKNRDIGNAWAVWVEGFTDKDTLYLNATDAKTSASFTLHGSIPTSTTIGCSSWLANSGDKIIAYCFADVPDYQKVGSYIGGGATNVPVSLGFQPRFVMLKRATGGAGSWVMYDNVRQTGTIPYDNYTILLADSNFQEQSENTIRGIQFTSDGFILNKDYTLTNNSLDTYIYLAIA